MLKKYKISLFIGLLLLAPIFINSGICQPPPPAGASCWPPPCMPIDGGISLLIIAGAAYGSKKAYNSIKQKSTVE